MKEGDIIEWKGVNIYHRGTLTQTEEGRWIVRMDNGHSFPLDDLRNSKSLREYENNKG